MNLAAGIQTDGRAIDDERFRRRGGERDGHRRGAVGAGHGEGQRAGMTGATIELQAARKGVSPDQRGGGSIKRREHQARATAGGVIDDRRVDGERACLVEKVEWVNTSAGPAHGQRSIAEGTADRTGEATACGQSARSQVELVGIIREGQALRIGATTPHDRVRKIDIRSRRGARGRERSAVETKVLRGGAGSCREDGGVVAPIACTIEITYAAGVVPGGWRHITGQFTGVGRPWDDAVDQRDPAGEDEAPVIPHLSGDIVQKGRVVGLGERTEGQLRGANRAIGAVGQGDRRLGAIEGKVTEGFSAIPLVTADESDGGSSRSDGRGVVHAVSISDGAEVTKRKSGETDLDRRSSGETTFIDQGQGATIDQRATRVGVVAKERHGARTRLVEEDASRAAGNVATPSVLGTDANEGRGRGNDVVHHGATAAREGRSIRRTQEAHHLAITVEVEGSARSDCEILTGRTTLGALPKGVFAPGQRDGAAVDGEVISPGVEELLGRESQIAA